MANYHPKTDHLKKTQWKKGQSGNPAGKPKGEHFKTRMRKYLEITQKVRNPLTGTIEEMDILEQMCLTVIMKARDGDLRAYQTVLNIVEGKPNRAKQHQSGETIVTPILPSLSALRQRGESLGIFSTEVYSEPSEPRKPKAKPKSEIILNPKDDRPHPLRW